MTRPLSPLDAGELTTWLTHTAQAIDRSLRSPDRERAIHALRDERDGALRLSLPILAQLALLADCLRVAHLAILADRRTDEDELTRVTELVRVAASKYCFALPRYDSFAESLGEGAAGIDEIARFLRAHHEDDGPFGFARPDAWPGHSLARLVERTTRNPAPLREHERMLVRIMDEVFQERATEVERAARRRLRELFAEPATPSAGVDPRAEAFCRPDGPEVFTSISHGARIHDRDPFDVETIDVDARDVFHLLVERATTPDHARHGHGRLLLVLGESGSGKTHLLRALRTQVHGRRLGYFGYLQLTPEVEDPARALLRSLVDSLERAYDPPVLAESGLMYLSDGLVEGRETVPPEDLERLRTAELSPDELAQLVGRLIDRILRIEGLEKLESDLVQALLLLQRRDPAIQRRVVRFLRCEPLNAYDRQLLGDLSARERAEDPLRTIQQLARAMHEMQLAALVLVVDQLEELIPDGQTVAQVQRALDSLRAIADAVPSAVIVVSCLGDIYAAVKGRFSRSLRDRLESDPPPIQLTSLRQPGEIEQMLIRRLEHLYAAFDVAWREDDPLFPFTPAQLEAVYSLRTRDSLAKFREYHNACIAAQAIVAPSVSLATQAARPEAGRSPEPEAPPASAPFATPASAPVATPPPAAVATPSPTPVAKPATTPVATPNSAPAAKPAPTPVVASPPTPVAKPATAPVATPNPAPVAKPATAPVVAPPPAPVAPPPPTSAPVAATPPAPAPQEHAASAATAAALDRPWRDALERQGAVPDEAILELVEDTLRTAAADQSLQVVIERRPEQRRRVTGPELRPRLFALCNRGPQGGHLGAQLETLCGAAAQAGAIPVALRSADFRFQPKTKIAQQVGALVAAGGLAIELTEQHLRIAAAARSLGASAPAGWAAWRRERRLLAELPFVQQILERDRPAEPAPAAPPPAPAAPQAPPAAAPAEPPQRPSAPIPAFDPNAIRLGVADSMRADPITLPLEAIKTHVAFLGSTGSGKTTAALSVVEQLLEHGISVLLVDRKGDLARYVSAAWWDDPAAPPADRERKAALRARIDVALYTPGNPQGHPLRLPLIPALDDATPHDREQLARFASTGLAAMMGYGASAAHRAKTSILQCAINLHAAERNISLDALLDTITRPDPELLHSVSNLQRHFASLAEDLQTLSIQRGSLLSGHGETLDVATLLPPPGAGRARLSIINTSALAEVTVLQFWISRLLVELGRLGRKRPSPTLQAAVFFDEADAYVPATSAPPTKEPMFDLLRRSRSTGIGVLLASQNPGDFDYKARDNIQTWLLGKVAQDRAIEKMRHLIANYPDVGPRLASQRTGSFFLLTGTQKRELKADRSLMETVQLSEAEVSELARMTRPATPAA